MTASPKLAAVASWLRQTSTIVGIATLGGTIAAVVAKQMTWANALPVAVGGLISMAIPGHPDTQAAATKAATDMVSAIQAKGLGTTTATLGADLVTLAGMLPDNTPVVAVQHTLTPIAPSAVPAVSTQAPVAVAPAAALTPVTAIVLLLGASVGLSACSPEEVAKVNTAASTVIADGQLVCKVGPTFLAMVSPSGAALLAKGAPAAAVAAACATVNGVATALPALTAAIPTQVTPPVALPTAPAPVSS